MRGSERNLGLHLTHPGPASPRQRRGPGGKGARCRGAAPRRRPTTAGQGPGGRVVRSSPDLHAHGPRTQHRRPAGGHQRALSTCVASSAANPEMLVIDDLFDLAVERTDHPGLVSHLRRRHATRAFLRLGVVASGAARGGESSAIRSARPRHHRGLVRDQDLGVRSRSRHRPAAGRRWRT